VHWFVTLTGGQQDVDRLLAASPGGLTAGSDPHEVLLEIVDPDHGDKSEEAFQAARALIDAQLRHLNGFGKLRWGRTFAGLTVKSVMYPDDNGGPPGQVVFVDSAHAHLLPEEYADMVERLGHPRPPLPVGIEDVNALNLPSVIGLAADDPEVARVLHLIELMLAGDDQIDWAAGYATLEVIGQSARDAGVDGQALGWWARKDRDRFRQMANSFEAVGIKSRHPGLRYRAPKKSMSPTEGAWFVRAVAARWIAWRSEAD
jgi:hypothetical protein